MLTKEDIREINNFNVPLLKLALSQAEQRLRDALDSKENREKKTFSLLTISIGLLTSAVAFSQLPFITGTLFGDIARVLGAHFFFGSLWYFSLSLKTKTYGALGRDG